MSTIQQVGIVGLGKVGMALARVLRKGGLRVRGIDIDPSRVAMAQAEGVIASDVDHAVLTGCELIFVLVTTTAADAYHYEALASAIAALRADWPQPEPIVIVSTCEPIAFAAPELVALKDRIIYSPVFVRQGELEHDILHPDLVLIGDDSPGRALSRPLRDLYEQLGLGSRVRVMDIASAAVTKLGINGFLTLKIAYANLIGDLCQAAGADADTALSAIGADGRIGTRYLSYGFGFGGPCLPIDTRALARTLVQYGLDDDLPQTVAAMNRLHLIAQIRTFTRAAGPPATAMPTTIAGVAFRPGTDIITHSQKLAFAVAIAQKGYRVCLRDSAAVIEQVRALYGGIFQYEAVCASSDRGALSVRVSLGEFLDRLSILRIKRARITDPRSRQFIARELAAMELLHQNTANDERWLSELTAINLPLWECNDARKEKLRRREYDDAYVQMSIQESTLNDQRFALKASIDAECESDIREQKSYPSP